MNHKSSSLFFSKNLTKAVVRNLLFWERVDWILLLLVIGLIGLGSLTIYSIELADSLEHSYQHLSVGFVGLFLAIAIARFNYRDLLKLHWLIYLITNISLLIVMLAGASAKGAQRWITIAGFNIQPSEFAKIAVIITLAALLHNRNAKNFSTVARTLAITAVPWSLVFFQPDLGTSLVFGIIVLTMLYWANTDPVWILLVISPLISTVVFHLSLPLWLIWIVVLVAIVFITQPFRVISTLSTLIVNLGAVELGRVFWKLLRDYQKDRLILFLNPEQDPWGGGYHLIQSRIAIGSGRLWGTGLYEGSQTQLNFIPEQHTDFVFSAIGEEWGFMGCLVLLGIFWVLCWRLIGIANGATDNFGSLLAIGVLSMVAFQVIINISMTVGLAPITGIPLPFMSYGRSSLLSSLIAIGLVESVSNNRETIRILFEKGKGKR